MAKVEKVQEKMEYKAFGKTKPMTTKKIEAKDKQEKAPDEIEAKEIL